MFICPVCGYPELDELPYDDFGFASCEICSCCGIEFGFDDSYLDEKEDCWKELREKWISEGMIWWSQYNKSTENWNPVEQTKNIDK